MSDPYRDPGMPSLADRIKAARHRLEYLSLLNTYGRSRAELDRMRSDYEHARRCLTRLLEEQRQAPT